MGNDQLIKDLDFVLTHPACSVENLESFYNNCLFLNDTVPLIIIVDHILKEKPYLLLEWSSKNKTIKKVISDMGVVPEEISREQNYLIQIPADFHSIRQLPKGFFRLVWKTDVEENTINTCFKRKTLSVKCEQLGDLKIVGFVKAEGKNEYNLYLRKKEEHK
ncbi:hypothetical protein P4K96_22820 [Bacillus cereus]|uniref:hypothetical protein n=1 Tax=Paenibacillus melissococcoides TaxID=2912268 RepID=UPI0021C3FA6A|nr:hypothetical protein [Paenibacillus melissococcoides]MEB9896279.1 hypothetical protein [Bacillus cereus]CAH8721287.1 hypothetical protein HTL2_006283 [Paenibacillus melissococcoides]